MSQTESRIGFTRLQNLLVQVSRLEMICRRAAGNGALFEWEDRLAFGRLAKDISALNYAFEDHFAQWVNATGFNERVDQLTSDLIQACDRREWIASVDDFPGVDEVLYSQREIAKMSARLNKLMADFFETA